MSRDIPGDGRKVPARFQTMEIGDRSTIVFVTICTKGRHSALADPAMHYLIQKWWRRNRGWRVGKYVILPEHMHFFCSPDPAAAPLFDWIAYWEHCVSREWTGTKPLWQRSFWDRQLRSGESYSAKWEYVRNNPVRHGLVENPKIGSIKAKWSL